MDFAKRVTLKTLNLSSQFCLRFCWLSGITLTLEHLYLAGFSLVWGRHKSKTYYPISAAGLMHLGMESKSASNKTVC